MWLAAFTHPGTGTIVRALAPAPFAFSSLGLMPVKGLPDAVEVFELIGAESARTRLQAAVTHGLTRFVGRHTEVQAFQAA